MNNICIVGAGPAGTTAALSLAKKGVAVTIFDKAVFPRDKVCGDALSGKVIDILKRLDQKVYEEFCDQPFLLGSWGVTFGSPGADQIHIPFRQNGRKPELPPGYISRRTDFDNFLMMKCRQEPLIDIREAEWVTFYEYKAGYWYIETQGGSKYTFRLIIAADGAHSSFAKKVAKLEVKNKHHAVGLRAYVKNVKGFNEENYIQILFLKNLLPGYFWLFPLRDGMANTGLGLRSDILRSRKLNLKKVYYDCIQNDAILKERFNNAEIKGDVKLFPLPLGSVQRQIYGDGYMLTGDAAALIDPFTGEGIGNAMLSGELAAEQAAECHNLGEYGRNLTVKYEKKIYAKIGKELKLSYRLQQLANYPSLFNFIVRKAKHNPDLQETISCMFDNLDQRSDLKRPKFYINLITK